jgi:hypothetical protein
MKYSMIRSLSLLPLAALLAAISWAQASNTALTVPVLGYLASDSPVSVRPIAGTPGAVVLGGSLSLPDGITRIIPAPGQQFALVEVSNAAGSGVVALGVAGASNVTAIANTFSHSDRIAFSPSGSVAVLYSAAAQLAQIVTGLPSSAQLSRTVDLSPAGLPLVSIAVSDDAQAILAGVSDRARGSIWSFVAGQSPRWVTATGVPSALRFFSGKQDAVAADKGWQQVLLLPAGAASQVLAGAEQGIRAPADLEISTDQQTVWVADSAAINPPSPAARRGTPPSAPLPTGKLLSIDVGSRTVGSVDSSIAAATLTRMIGDSVFLLKSQDGSSSGIWSPRGAVMPVWRLTGASAE